MSASIKVRDLTKIFALAEHGGGSASLLEILRSGKHHANAREVRALDRISFDIGYGERVGIIGRNGAGKTTLLSILAGLTDATSGAVEVEGDMHAMLSIGAVLREDMTGRENILLDASIHGRTKRDINAVVDRIVEFSELGEFIERAVRTYSSGMKARLAFSMGAFIEPDILVLDETLSVGDAFFSKKATRRMREVASSGSIVIVVSHAMAAINDMCTRCLWLDNGRIAADGDPRTVTKQYELAVQQSDEDDLRRKFSDNIPVIKRPSAGNLEAIRITQNAAIRPSTLIAMKPVIFGISGTIVNQNSFDVRLRISRVDGRNVWEDLLTTHRSALSEGAFSLSLKMEPFVLGADLYRLDVELLDPDGVCDSVSRVFEVVDEEGQFGGRPLLYYPGAISVRRLDKAG